MNAGPLFLVDLLTSAGHRFVIPVYQRPYSWDEEQCERLWQDILAVGRRPKGSTHFTGAVVWIQDGTMSAAGVTPLLVIDGQQRITTLTLLLIALAEYARNHAPAAAFPIAPAVATPSASPAITAAVATPTTPAIPEIPTTSAATTTLPPLAFSSEEILRGGYLVNPYRHGDDRYRLTLTQGDESTLRSLLDHLENPDAPVDRSSTRLLANLDLFRRRLEGIADPNVVWTGLQRLEVVSISLTQGHDDPQLIFETMNSTGKDLSVADLVRNEVLMDLPIDDQADLYRNQWRPIEEILSSVRNSGQAVGVPGAAGAKAVSAASSAGGVGSSAGASGTGVPADDRRFDGFLHDWLTVVNAPTPVVSRDLFREFRRYREAREDATVGALGGAAAGGAVAGGPTTGVSETSVSVIPLLREMRRFAGHYAAIVFHGAEDPRLDAVLSRLRMLDMSAAWPLVMTLLDWHDGQSSVGTASDPWQGSTGEWLPANLGSIAPGPAGYGPMAAGMAYDGMADEAADYGSAGPGVGPGMGGVGDFAGRSASALSTSDLVSMLRTLDSYLFRRMACGVAGNGLGGFLSSLIARLDQIRRDGGNIREAFEAMLLGEAGTTRRMPDDEEFRSTLATRDCYAFRRGLYLLAALENSRRPKNPIDFAHGVYTIEHIMPRNALAREEWRSMLGLDCQDVFTRDVNRLGNLTLTAYNSELSDASFEEKKRRLIGGYEGSGLGIDRALRDATEWTDDTITARGKELAEQAIGTWPMPYLPQDAIERYRETRRAGRGGAQGGSAGAGPGAVTAGGSAAGRPTVGFRDLCLFGLLDSGVVLVSRSVRYPARAIVTDDYRIRLENGEEFDSPSAAAHRGIALAGGSAKANGWDFWGVDGSSLAAVRSRYLRAIGGVCTADKTSTRRMFWEEFHRYCAGRPDVVDAFGDPSLRKPGTDSWTSYGIGESGCHVDALLGLRDGYLGVDLYFSDVGRYRRLVERRGRVEMLLTPITGGAPGRVASGTSAGAEPGAGLHWDAPDATRQGRAIVVRRAADFDSGDWTELDRWLADALLLMRRAAQLSR